MIKLKKRNDERIDWWGRRSTCRKAIAKFACIIANYIIFTFADRWFFWIWTLLDLQVQTWDPTRQMYFCFFFYSWRWRNLNLWRREFMPNKICSFWPIKRIVKCIISVFQKITNKKVYRKCGWNRWRKIKGENE